MTYLIKSLSVSKVDLFEACPRHWWFDFPEGLKPEQTKSQSDGEAGHALIEAYLKTGQLPKPRAKMGKVVTQAIQRGLFPAPAGDLHVERRFSGQPKLDAEGKWLPLDPGLSPLWTHGIPWDGFTDLVYRSGDVVDVEDHKFVSDPDAPWVKTAKQLLGTVQMPGNALVAATLWPDVRLFNLTHNVIPKNAQVMPEKRTVLVTLDQIKERWASVEGSVLHMKAAAAVTVQGDVEARKGSACEAYGGCPHQSRCTKFKERKKLNLTAEEMALFADLDSTVSATPAPAPAVADTSFDFGANVTTSTAQIPDSVAAVIPPDAPANDATLAPPEKKAKAKKAEPAAVPAQAELAVSYKAPELATVVPQGAPAPRTITVQIELGPETRALIAQLLAALSK